MNDCQLDKEPLKQCCCMCRLQVPVYDDGLARMPNTWACLAFVVDEQDKLVVLTDEQHNCGCEMFSDKRKSRRGELIKLCGMVAKIREIVEGRYDEAGDMVREIREIVRIGEGSTNE